MDYRALIALLDENGIRQPRQAVCDSADDVVAAAAQFDSVVLKLVSPELVHKSDVGAVLLNRRGEDSIRTGADSLEQLAESLSLLDAGILVQEMTSSSEAEVFVGVKRDPVFGPVIVVGAGGRLVELMPAVSIRECPVTAEQAREMLVALPIGRLLSGYRGAADVLMGTAELISRASTLLDAMPDAEEIDLNPVLVDSSGPLAVDARAVLRQPATESVVSRVEKDLDLRPLLEPASLVVVGASASGAAMPGNRVLRYLRKFGYVGRVHVVHPSATEIDGFPCVPSFDDLVGEPIDLACIAVAASKTIDALEHCGKLGVPAAIVFGSGFAEIGVTELEAELGSVADRYGIVLCGPNTVGVISPAQHVHACFSQAQNMDEVVAGGTALVVQSGALGGSVISQAWQRGIGFSRFISVGNQACVGTTDYLNYLVTDPATTNVAVLIEGIADGRALTRAVRRLTAAGKQTLILKVGRGAAGAKAVQSHTGSIAGDYAVFHSLLTAAGAVIVDSMSDVLDILALRSAGFAPRAGSRMAVLSTSGGACGIVADLCERYEFDLTTFDSGLRDALTAVLPSFASTANPVDVTGQVTTDPAIYGRALKLVLASEDVELVTVMLTTIADPEAELIAEEIVGQISDSDKPVLVSWTIAPELAARGLAVFQRSGVPVFDDPARAIRAAALMRS